VAVTPGDGVADGGTDGGGDGAKVGAAEHPAETATKSTSPATKLGRLIFIDARQTRSKLHVRRVAQRWAMSCDSHHCGGGMTWSEATIASMTPFCPGSPEPLVVAMIA
jgi:hypothetical protein